VRAAILRAFAERDVLDGLGLQPSDRLRSDRLEGSDGGVGIFDGSQGGSQGLDVDRGIGNHPFKKLHGLEKP